MTTIGKYGSGTTRSKIPIGAFYGHSYILPWEWSPKPEHHLSPSTSSVACQLDLPSQSQLVAHLGSFMSLLEDIQVFGSSDMLVKKKKEYAFSIASDKRQNIFLSFFSI